MILTGAEIANSGGSKFTQEVECPWCLTASTLDLGPQHVHGDLTLHCRKCAKFSRHKTADRWFDQHQERMEELKDVWKKIPNDAYISCRQSMRGTPFVYTVSLGGTKRAEEYMSRDIVCDMLTEEYGMSYMQAHRALMSAALTPGQRIYLQRHTRLVMAATAREEMKRTGVSEQLIPTGASIRVNGSDGIFLRYSGNEGFAIVALPTPGIEGFGDAEVPVMELEVLDAGGPEVAEDFMFDKEMDENGEEAAEVGGLEQALEHIEIVEEIVEDLVLEEGGEAGGFEDEHGIGEADGAESDGDEPPHEEEGDDPKSSHGEEEEGEEKKPPFAASRRAAMPGAPRPSADPQIAHKLQALQGIIQDPNTDPQTLAEAQKQWTQLKRQVPASRLAGCDHNWVPEKKTGGERCSKCGASWRAGQRTAFFGYRTEDDLEAMERPNHKTKGPKLTDTKLKGDSWVPRNEGKNPMAKEDTNLNKKANAQAQRKVHTHFMHSGDLRRAIDVNRDSLSIEDIRNICKFYANTGKIAHHEADELAFWFIGDKPRLLCASDMKTAGPAYEEWLRKKNKPAASSACTCKNQYDRYCPEHGAQESKHSAKEKRHTCSSCGEQFTTAREHPTCPYCNGSVKEGSMSSGKKRGRGALSLRDLRVSAKDAGEAEVPDAHPESGVSSGSGATSTPDPKRQSGESANSVTGPEKVRDHGSGASPKDSGDVNVPDLGVPKGASMRRKADGTCQKCGTPLDQSGMCPTCNSSAEQQQAQDSPMTPTTALSARELPRYAARHKDGCGCGFCTRMKENSEWSKSRKPKEALSIRDGFKNRQAHDGVGIFMPATHNGTRVLVIAIDNTSLRATVQDGEGNQRQVAMSDLEPVETGPYSGMPKSTRSVR